MRATASHPTHQKKNSNHIVVSVGQFNPNPVQNGFPYCTMIDDVSVERLNIITLIMHVHTTRFNDASFMFSPEIF